MNGARSSKTGTSDPTVNLDSMGTLLVTTRTAAQLLCLSERTIWSLANSGTLRSVKIGRAVRFSTDDLRTWVAAGCPRAGGVA